ncbi:hypothetical protein REPUB_Repub05bG0013800 [Reevesia pubescens]
MRKVGIEVIGLGALKLTGFLKELMQQNNIHFESLYTMWTLKEQKMIKLIIFALVLLHPSGINALGLWILHYDVNDLCYVVADYKAELSKDTHASLEIPVLGARSSLDFLGATTLQVGDMDSAYAEVLSTGDDLLLIKVMDRSDPMVDQLSNEMLILYIFGISSYGGVLAIVGVISFCCSTYILTKQ